jgi:hypothetical protein
VRKYLGRRPLRRRIIALAAAYAIALSSLIASFGAASAAAEAAAIPGGIICHTVIDGQHTPAPAQGNGKLCIDCCCGVGCTMLMAALPPPPTAAAPLSQASSDRVASSALAVHAGGHEANAHRSRAPPLTA